MEIKAILNKPFEENERMDFIVEQNHQNGYEIREVETGLEAWGYTEEELAQQEKERIGKLKLTRGDVFKAILLAQGLSRNDLREMITRNETVPILQKELALIDFDEALDFYRKNPLIDLMGNSLGIDKTHLDNFFIKGNNEETKSEAWKELVVESEPTETPTEEIKGV